MSDLAETMQGMLDATRRQAEVEAAVEVAMFLRRLAMADTVRCSSEPLPRHASRARRRLRRDQERFGAWWRGHCVHVATLHAKAAESYASAAASVVAESAALTEARSQGAGVVHVMGALRGGAQ